MSTPSKYFEVTLRVDQAAALNKVLDDNTLTHLTTGIGSLCVISKKEAKMLRGLRSQIDVEMADRCQDDVNAVRSSDQSPSNNECEPEHPTDCCEADGEVKGKHWLGKVKEGKFRPSSNNVRGKENTTTTTILCWDHCRSCNQSQNRFWVKTLAEFEKHRAEKLKHLCSFCNERLVSYNEKTNPS